MRSYGDIRPDAALQEHTGLMECMVASITEGSTLVDRAGQLVFANPAAERILDETRHAHL